VPVKRVGTPEEIARTIVFLSSDKASSSGASIAVDAASWRANSRVLRAVHKEIEMTTECPTQSLTPMPITDRSSDIRIYLLNVTLVLNASAAKLAALCRDHLYN